MYVIGVVSQKGGVGKSSLSQLVAMGYGINEYSVLLADMDTQQMSSSLWHQIREEKGLDPIIAVKPFSSVSDALKEGENYDLLIFDGAPHATVQTLEIARIAHLLLLPTNASRFDLEPQVKLANELVGKKIKPGKIHFFLNRLGSSVAERKNAYEYIEKTPYKALPIYLEDKTSYRYAAELGKPFTETGSGSLNSRSQGLFSNISTIMLKMLSNVNE